MKKNSKGKYEVDLTNCPANIRQIRTTVHKARGIPIPFEKANESQSHGKKEKIFGQLNISGLSGHSEIASNQYVHEKDPKVMFLNKTKAKSPRQFENNYNAFSERKHGSGEWQYY